MCSSAALYQPVLPLAGLWRAFLGRGWGRGQPPEACGRLPPQLLGKEVLLMSSS